MNRPTKRPLSRLFRKKLTDSQGPRLAAQQGGGYIIGDCDWNAEALEPLKVDPHSSHILSDGSRTISPDSSSPVLRNQFLELTESASQSEKLPSSGKRQSTPTKWQKSLWRDIPRNNNDGSLSSRLMEIPLEWLQLTQPQSSDYLSHIWEEPQSSTIGNTTLGGPYKVQVHVKQSSPKGNPPLRADLNAIQKESKQPTGTLLNTRDKSKGLLDFLQMNYRPEFDMKIQATPCHDINTVPQDIKLNQTQCGHEPHNASLTQASAQKIIRLYSGIMHRIMAFCVEQKKAQDLAIKKLEAHKKTEERMMSDYHEAMAENGHLRSQLQTTRQNATGIHSIGECSKLLWDELENVMTGFQIDISTNQITHQWMWEGNRRRYAALESEEHALVAKFQTLFNILMEERRIFAYSKEINLELKSSPMDTLVVQRLFDDVFFYLQTLRDVEKIERSTLAAFVAKVNSIHVEVKLKDGYLHQALQITPSSGTQTKMKNDLCTQSGDNLEGTSRRLSGGDSSGSKSEVQVNQKGMTLRGGMGKDLEYTNETHANLYI